MTGCFFLPGEREKCRGSKASIFDVLVERILRERREKNGRGMWKKSAEGKNV